MPLFRCEACGCVENTACSNYHTRHIDWDADTLKYFEPKPPALCSECDPKIGAWHGHFPRRSADGMLVGDDGYLWEQSQFDRRVVTHTTPVARIVDGKVVPL